MVPPAIRILAMASVFPLTALDDAILAAAIAELVDLINIRRAALGLSAVSISGVAAGDTIDFADIEALFNAVGTVANAGYMVSADSAGSAYADTFFDGHTDNPPGGAAAPYEWVHGNVSIAAPRNIGPAALLEGGTAGYQFKKPRRISSLAAGGVNGQKAIFASEFISIPYAGETGLVYTRTGGAWVNGSGRETPDVISEFRWFPVVGDYWTIEPLNGAFRVLKLLRWIAAIGWQPFSSPFVQADYTNVFRRVGTGPVPADAETDWDANAEFAASMIHPTVLAEEVSGGNDTLQRHRYTPRQTGIPGAHPRDLRFYIWTSREPPATLDEYDANGDGPPFVEDQWNLIHTVAASTAASVSAPAQGNTTVKPNWNVTAFQGRGYSAGLTPFVLIQHDFSDVDP